MAGFEESDLYAAFGLDQPAGENDPAPAEPGQAAQTQTTEPQAGGGEQQPAQTQEQEPSQDQGDGEGQGGADGAGRTVGKAGRLTLEIAPYSGQLWRWQPKL